MIAFAVLCIILPNLLDAALEPGLVARHNNGDDTYTYFDLPQTTEDALTQGWEENEKPEEPSQYAALTLYCKESDKTICLLYDIKGNVAGAQISLNKKYLTDLPFDMPGATMVDWTSTENGTATDFYSSTMYFVANDSAVNTVSKSSSVFLPEDAIYVSSFDKSVYKVFANVTKDTDFVHQKCITAVGDHYLYKMTEDIACNADTIYPWFILTQGTDIVSMAWYIIGKRTLPEGQWDWLERWNRTVVEQGVAYGPECYYDWVEQYPLIGFKLFLVKDPEAITC